MPSRVAIITWLDEQPVDPGYGVTPPAHIGGGPIYGGGRPVDPGYGRPSWGPVDPGYGRPGWSPVDPGYGQGGGLRPGGGPVYPPGHPSAGLPVAPAYPSHGLPGEGGEPVDPAWGFSPLLGWFVVYCKGGAQIDNSLPEEAAPK